jgi:hypothetical protein
MDRRAEDQEAAIHQKYRNFLSAGECRFLLFTNDRHSLYITIRKTNTRRSSIIAETDNILLLRKSWVPRAMGEKDFRAFVTNAAARGRELRTCRHCTKITAETICPHCALFLVNGEYQDCIACCTQDHPIAWKCMTCLDSVYCSKCIERLPNGRILCPTCKQPNDAIDQTKTIITFTTESSSESSDETEDEDEEMVAVDVPEEPEISDVDRVVAFAQHSASLGESRVLITAQTLCEVKLDSADSRMALCRDLSDKGYRVFLGTSHPWAIAIVFDDELSVLPFPNAEEIRTIPTPDE